MSADLVNLRQFKKSKVRRAKEEAAENNRIAFGRTKSEKAQTRKINKQQERAHERGRLEKSSDKQPPK
ncbi:MAG: DUF4169 family protein [Hyphomicrobiales bacterium]|nr:DUF4169 family protein [Hyphomicrobiales bacterium]MCP4999478.1 DUF4169 family protein [Hyphomicrobiales bacterium]